MVRDHSLKFGGVDRPVIHLHEAWKNPWEIIHCKEGGSGKSQSRKALPNNKSRLVFIRPSACLLRSFGQGLMIYNWVLGKKGDRKYNW